MLVLSRRKSEVIVIGAPDAQQAMIRIVVVDIGKGFVKLGIAAPASVSVRRMEVWARPSEDVAAGLIDEALSERDVSGSRMHTALVMESRHLAGKELEDVKNYSR